MLPELTLAIGVVGVSIIGSQPSDVAGVWFSGRGSKRIVKPTARTAAIDNKMRPLARRKRAIKFIIIF